MKNVKRFDNAGEFKSVELIHNNGVSCGYTKQDRIDSYQSPDNILIINFKKLDTWVDNNGERHQEFRNKKVKCDLFLPGFHYGSKKTPTIMSLISYILDILFNQKMNKKFTLIKTTEFSYLGKPFSEWQLDSKDLRMISDLVYLCLLHFSEENANEDQINSIEPNIYIDILYKKYLEDKNENYK